MLFEGAIGAMRPGAGLGDFLVLLAIVLAGVVLVDAGTAVFAEVMSARHPERKIQKNRTNPRKWKEFRDAPLSLFLVAISLAGGLFCQWQGWAMAPLETTWWSIPLMFVVGMLIYDAWFYWTHRFLHWGPMYRFHAKHHACVCPTVWSVHQETIVDSLFDRGFFLFIVFLLPIPWPALVVLKIYDLISAMLGHCGFEFFASPTTRAPWPFACITFHDQHHSHFRYNYAHSFTYWDRLMGTLHSNYDERVREFEAMSPPAPKAAPAE